MEYLAIVCFALRCSLACCHTICNLTKLSLELNHANGVRALGEGFQILQWDVINKKKKNQSKHYENSGTVILKSISIEQVSKKRRYQMTFVAKAF